MARLRPPEPKLFLSLKDRGQHKMSGLFFVGDTLDAIRLRWLMEGLQMTQEEAYENRQRCHISMVELLGSLGSVILDVRGQSLRDLEGLKNRATLIPLWHWAEECDGMAEAELMAWKLEMANLYV
ncbi:hypothetical protein VI817_000158 [Penicillium citrinum]|nr:hypothetical protein VI817_000158 [Penicillium citrinum]